MVRDVAVLVSVGRHPASGRPRRADLDARAIELALGLRDSSAVGAGLKPAPTVGTDIAIHIIHAGDPAEPALRDYLGMGIESLTVIECPAEADPLPALVENLGRLRPGLVLTGAAAEAGPCSGFLPYALAAALDYVLAPAIVAIEIEGGRARLLQALPRGRRRAIEAPLPLVATVDRAAPRPRLAAHGPARRGRIELLPGAAEADPWRAAWREQPARPRPKRLRVATGGSAAERLRALAETPAGRGQVLVDPAPDEAARAIRDYLVAEGILRPQPAR
ncbi:MAG TPA: electron transfer flavoprotein subunit beta [Dongiaceae bacterium]|nr:electron transfer flavoprotein subunit beta [Dongiaceae bacterium]